MYSSSDLVMGIVIVVIVLAVIVITKRARK